MKAIKTLNTIALCIPIFISLFAIFESGLLALALLSTMVTGLIQMVLAFKYWQENPKNIFINIYFFIVAVFFSFYVTPMKVGFDIYLQSYVYIYHY